MMPISAGRIMNFGSRLRPTTAGLAIGGAAAVGAGQTIASSEGPYGDIQENMLGDRNAIRSIMQARLHQAFADNSMDLPGPSDYYYGQPVDVSGMMNRRSSGRSGPVSGESVFGMYNLRRG